VSARAGQPASTAPPPDRTWRLWIDTGGTFTDCVAIAPDGEARRVKTLSSGALRGRVLDTPAPDRWRVDLGAVDPGALRGMRTRAPGAERGGPAVRAAAIDRGDVVLTLDQPTAPPGDVFEVAAGEPAPTLAARLATNTPLGAALPPMTMRLATTRGTNALLERATAPVALFVTRGFADTLRIADQRRPELFTRCIRKPEPLAEVVVEVDERLDARGDLVAPLDLDGVEAAASDLLRRGVRAAAVSLLHSWTNPEHERAVAERLRALGFTWVTCSSDMASLIRHLPRTQTAVVDAALSPIVGDYLREVSGAVATGRLLTMTSAGGLVDAARFHPAEGLLSGPAGGVVGAAAAGRRSGLTNLISFDMGGTSTDVARIGEGFDYAFEHTVGEARLLAPALAIETVAAGGGSVCWADEGRPAVGPHSAGASPGPACYGADGPLTITDVNLLLGRLDPDVFGVPLQVDAATRAFDELLERLDANARTDAERDALLQGLLDIANERMAQTIRRVSVERGHDPRRHALVAFGGAGPQHACAVASLLGIERVIVPSDASLLSAVGVGAAAIERFAERQTLRPLEVISSELPVLMRALEDEASASAAADGAPAAEIEIARRLVNLRLAGQDHTIPIDWTETTDLSREFARAFERIFGRPPPQRAIEVESVRVVAAWRDEAPALQMDRASGEAGAARGLHPVCFAGRRIATPVFDRERLSPGEAVVGPALVMEARTATVVEPGWEAALDDAGALALTRASDASTPAARDEQRSALVRSELLVTRLTAAAEETGALLARTALSINVKERLDFSCAILDPDAELVAAAPHMPVHLGALDMCVRGVRDAVALAPGDVVVTNHPRFGGSHLPDITVVAPIYDASESRLLGYVANRAHHAEIGGVRPASMPPDARTLAEEGVVVPPMHIVRRGEARWDDVRRLFEEAPHPTRGIEENMADLAAQVASARRGIEAVRQIEATEGEAALCAAMASLLERSDERVRAGIDRLSDEALSAEERLDDGSPIRVRISKGGPGLVIDFAGSAETHPGNLNAPFAVVRSAVAYVVRLLVDEPMPLNGGLLRAVEIRIPPGMLNPQFDDDPAKCPAVAAGNVETSQRVTDALIRALSLGAAGQGTMNNTLFGSQRFGYYETLGGGAGATAECDGASGVHVHMSNTAITDAEVLEQRYPVRVERFEIRRGSGGAGAHRGGDGLVRELRFLEAASLSVVTQNRVRGPRGAAGGGDGASGRNTIVRADGSREDLGSIGGAEMAAGDRLVIETPGGGGWGPS